MRQRYFTSVILSLPAVAGCAEILGLEPPDPTSSGGAGGAAPGDCEVAADCPVAGLPPCTLATCEAGKCVAAPAATGTPVPCYTGVPVTEGVGLCKSGMQMCNDGKPAGECTGQVLPADQEICGNGVDDDCDGVALCPGEIIAATALQGAGKNELRGVLAGPFGEVYVTGHYEGGSALAGCMFPALSGAFLARLSNQLECEWLITATGGPETAFSQLAFAADGRVWAVGSITARGMNLVTGATGAPVSCTPDGTDGLVLAATTDGEVESVTLIGGTGNDHGASITAGAEVHALVEVSPVAGKVKTASGAELLSYNGMYTDISGVIVGFNGLVPGAVSTFGASKSTAPRAIAATDDRLYLGGGFAGKASFTSDCTPENLLSGSNAFLFNILDEGSTDKSDVCLSSGSSVPGDKSYTARITPGAGGTYVVAGYGNSGVIGACLGDLQVGVGGWVRIGKGTDTCTAKTVLYSNGGDVILTDAVLENKSVVIGGSFTGQLDGQESDSRDIFIHRYTEALDEQLWSTHFGSSGDDAFWDLEVSPSDGSVWVVGACAGSGLTDKITCDADGDGFLVRLAP